MEVSVKITIPSDDHLFLEETLPEEYDDSSLCDGCSAEMTAISVIKNISDDIGLVTGLCPECGYIKRIRNLSPDAYISHFSEKWLVLREEEIVESRGVFNRLKPYICESGTVLDIGCGLGGSLLPFHESGYEVYGVEPSRHRSAKAQALMNNVVTGTAESYLSNSDRKFDMIFIFNVLQFLDNPFYVLEKAVEHLSENGVLYFKVGAFGHKSDYSQFSHMGVIKNSLSLYALRLLIERLSLHPIYYNEEPFELVLSKRPASNSSMILSSAVKIDENAVEKYVKKTLKINWLRIFGKTKLSYMGRKTELVLKHLEGDILPVKFCHNSSRVPLILK